MKYRFFIVIGALALPLIGVFTITQLAEHEGEQATPPRPGSIPVIQPQDMSDDASLSTAPDVMSPTEEKTAPKVPETLAEARLMAKKRRDELKELNQEEWDVERMTILDRSPPQTIAAAIARAELRVNDLMAMSETDWKSEKLRLYAREREKQANAPHQEKKDSKEAEAFRNWVEDAFKRANEGK